MAHDIGFAVEQHRSWIGVGVNGIDQDDGIIRAEMIDQVKGRGAQIGNFDASGELVVSFEEARDVGSYAVVAQQDVSDAADQYFSHSTFTLAIWRPDGSKVWQAQAMQGSKE